MANPPQNVRRGSWLRFRYDENNDSLNDTRSVLLIVTALITTVTFQAGKTNKAGRAIYSSQKVPFYAFLMCNTLAFSTSILVLTSLTYRFPFYIELWVAIGAMFGTYAAAIFAIAPDESVKFRYLLIISAIPFIIRILVEIYKWLMKRCKTT